MRRVLVTFAALTIALAAASPAPAYTLLMAGLPQERWTTIAGKPAPFPEGIIMCVEDTRLSEPRTPYNFAGNNLYENRYEYRDYFQDMWGSMNSKIVEDGWSGLAVDPCPYDPENLTAWGKDIGIYWSWNLGSCKPGAGNYLADETIVNYASKIRLNADCINDFGLSFFDWHPAAPSSDNKVDISSMMVHELGHTWGMNHSNDPTHLNLMDTPYPQGTGDLADENNCSDFAAAELAGPFQQGRIAYLGHHVTEIDEDTRAGFWYLYLGDHEYLSYRHENVQCD